jgi:hypothetical protein
MANAEPSMAAGGDPLRINAPALPMKKVSAVTPVRANLPPKADLDSPRPMVREPLPSLGELVEDSPPWLVSAVFHMLIVIILGLIVIDPKITDGLLLEFSTNESEVPVEGDLDVPIGVPEGELTGDPLLQNELEVEESLSDVDTRDLLLPDPDLTGDMEPIRLALSGREAGMQQALLGAYGGTGGTQRAVMEALKWLARNQGRNGTWSLQGKYSDGARNENFEAATAMALIAFQGAGYTPQSPQDGPFTDIVTRGWTALLSKQEPTGNFFQAGQGTSQLYTHAFCTIALCELYGMTKDERYRDPAQRAIDYCVEVQAPEGGWKYFPGTGSDLSVTGWFVMALQSGRMAGLKVPSETLLNVGEFLDSVSHEYGSFYAYQDNSPPSKSMTAEGLLCRQYLGWGRDDERLVRGANYLLDNLPEWKLSDRDAYYWYYATQVCHHMEGRHWQTWNKTMRELIPQNQVKDGKERGSWDPKGFRWDTEGGRLFITCLNTYMLEVYYRHLPIYQQEALGRL